MSFHNQPVNSKTVGGNTVYYDEVRGRWTVLFTRDNIRKQYDTEAQAIEAAGGAAESLGDKNTAVVPKQAVQTAVSAPVPAVKEFVDKSQTIANQRVSVQGSVINKEVGVEEDGFKSLSATTTKGDANEGPSISIMTKNIKKGKENIVKTVSAKSKLESVTGKPAKTEVVLNETVIQANPSGGIQALRNVAKVSNKQLPDCFDKSSPVPSLVKEAVDVDVNQGGIENKVAQDMRKASLDVIEAISKPFGSNNKNGSAGSSFGNIFAQLIAVAQNAAETYKSPTKAVKVAAASTIKNEKNETIPTPNITNDNGTTNAKNVVTKSSTEDMNPETESSIPAYEVGSGLRNYNVYTKTEFNGGTFRFPMIGHESHLTAEFKACTREITHLVVFFTKYKSKQYYMPEQLQASYYTLMEKRYGQPAVQANPKLYGINSHFYVNEVGGIHVTRDLNTLCYKKGNITDPYTGAIFLWIDAGEDDWPTAVNVQQMAYAGLIIDKFLEAYPGAEVLGLSDIRPDVTNNPPIDLREFVKSRNRKASTFKERKIDAIPPASDLADRQPANIPLPKKPSSTKIPNIAQVARQQNKIATVKSVNYQNYAKSQIEALNLIKEKNDLIVKADKTFGSGKLGNLLGKVNGLDGIAKNLLDTAQDLKQGELKIGKVFDSIKGVFK